MECVHYAKKTRANDVHFAGVLGELVLELMCPFGGMMISSSFGMNT
jgi:hypothetical protein